MLPSYVDGDLLIGSRRTKPKVGDVVIANLERPTLKRIIRWENDGWWLEGDNAHQSRDSRTFGPVDPFLIEAVIIYPRRVKA